MSSRRTKITKETVAVGMSGGVDSSVSAKILLDQGYDVVGVFMRNWVEENSDGKCTSAIDFEDAQKVCDHLDIPLYPLDFSKEYWNKVFQGFLDDLKKGLTPNPDILCNKEIKFKVLYEAITQMGISKMATGHYAQIGRSHYSEYSLQMGLDPNKDQSYFLYAIDPKILPNILFPVGNLLKTQVREIARDAKLPVATKRDSTGICFIGERNFSNFLTQFLGYNPGPMVDDRGVQVGTHQGLAYYTIGQRKGLGLGGPGEPWFVAQKHLNENTLVVVRGYEHPLLYNSSLEIKEIHSHHLDYFRQLPLKLEAKIRYRQSNQSCTLNFNEKNCMYEVSFDQPQRAITPQQSIVFYKDNIVLGGGFIEKSVF